MGVRNFLCYTGGWIITVCILVTIFIQCVHLKVEMLSCMNKLPENETREAFNSSWFNFCRDEQTRDPKCVIQAALILPFNDKFQVSKSRIQPIIDLAFRHVKQRQLLPVGVRLELTPYDGSCSQVGAMMYAFDAFHFKRPHVFFGPTCEYAASIVGKMVKFWNIPLLTIGAMTYDFNARKTFCDDQYHLMVRVGNVDFDHISYFLLRIFKKYGWNKTALIYYIDHYKELSGDQTCKLMMESFVRTLKDVNATYVPIDITNKEDNGLLQDLKKTYEYGVIVICAKPKTVRRILLAAHELNLVKSGEYIFFNIELFNSANNRSQQPWMDGNNVTENEIAKEAYSALLTVTARTPETEGYKNFSHEVKNLALTKYNYTYPEDSVSTFVTAFYDAVILYALALNKTLQENGSALNGSEITRHMWNTTFSGIAGAVHIDGNGDRIADYSLLSLNPETDRFEVVANYIGSNGTLEMVLGKKIHWPGGRQFPPPDTPECGFDGAKCQILPEYGIVSIVLSTIVVVMGAASICIYRHYKLEAEVASMTWRIYPEELVYPDEKHAGSKPQLNARRGSHVTAISDGVISTTEMKQVFIRRAIYKKNAVAIKESRRQRIELTRPLLFELKHLKDLHHDHLVRFYGACIAHDYVLLVTEYCPRGSLQDVLENEEIELDWMFKFSLMLDIVRGMMYLHSTEFKSHGNLKSSNCLVDARFVLKISDFGLHALRCTGNLTPDDHAYWKRFFWTAPELLRIENPLPEGTQKGDVYSFGIIIHEMLTRQGPFYVDDAITPRRIVENVKNGQKQFRPTVDELATDDSESKEVVSLMRRCWGEDPADRPDFSALKNHISKLNKKNESGNILDNLLSRMEQYANNLEALVEERTSDYLEEKKKCEELLYQLLPKSVASQLIKGQSVIAETYDQVTIYFSDIVGFTSLSAESTPMQVVDLLNDLYTCFDSIIENFDVYKVETIGDAYMVVSGLPGRNGNLHAREIARMSLALLAQVRDFRIRHRPNTQLKLRIGMHTGPCVAGVVGLKMPRYCLFGDTVNTASRMESNGEALKIHVSPKTKEVLDTFSTFELECRGNVEMKGKGVMTTYWLLGEKPSQIPEEPPKVPAETTLTTTNVVDSLNAKTSNNLANNVALINNIEVKNFSTIIPNSSTPLLTNASLDSLV